MRIIDFRPLQKPTPTQLLHTSVNHKKAHNEGSSKMLSYFPALCPEHAGLALEVLRLSALSFSDAVAVVMRCEVLLPCRHSFCALLCCMPWCCPHWNYCTSTTARMAIAACCAVVVCFGVLVLLCRSPCCAVYPRTILAETTSTTVLYTRYTWYDVPGTRHCLTCRTTTAVQDGVVFTLNRCLCPTTSSISAPSVHPDSSF